MEFTSSRQRRNRHSNRNFFIISIGFVLLLMVVIFGVQNLMLKTTFPKATRYIHCEIGNQLSEKIYCKMKVGDVILFDDSLQIGKNSFEKKWHFDSLQTITAHFNNKKILFENISVTDSIQYLMIEILPETDSSFSVKGNLFKCQ